MEKNLITDTGIPDKLLDGEKILWDGQPKFRLFNRPDLFLVPFTLLWAGLAVFWEAATLQTRPLVYQIYGFVFIIMAIYLVIGRFFYKAYVTKRTYYYVTNQRAIILKRLREITIQDIAINKIKKIEKKINGDGGGMLRFGSTPGILKFYENIGFTFIVGLYRKSGYAPAFYNIENAEVVYQLVDEQLRRKV